MYIDFRKHDLENSFFSTELARIVYSDAKKRSTWDTPVRIDQNLHEITVREKVPDMYICVLITL